MKCQQCGAVPEPGDTTCRSCGAPISALSKADPLIGRTLVNQYIIKRLIGKGGFGALYEAEQPAMRRKVAIKTLHRHLVHNEQIVARFHREAMAASQLEHPYAIKMFNSGQTEDEILWLAMEFLSGENLNATLKKRGPLSVEETIQIMEPVCEILAEAHQKSIIHRDLKPDNIMLVPSPTGRTIPKILDFGIAGILDNSSQATKSGFISGTPQYMSPEQWKGLKYTDARSDIYSLGLIIYQCLSRKLPFEADTSPGWMQKHCLEAPRPLIEVSPNISVALNDAVMKALAKDPSQRYASTTELFHGLRGSTQGAVVSTPSMTPTLPVMQSPITTPTPPTITPTSIENKAEPPTQRKTVWIVFAVLVLLLAFALGKKSRGPQQVNNNPISQPISSPTSLTTAPTSISTPKSAPVTIPATVSTKRAKTTIKGEPPGAQVFQREELLGAAPVEIDTPAAGISLSLVVRADGFEEQRLNIKGGQSKAQTVRYKLERKQAPGELPLAPEKKETIAEMNRFTPKIRSCIDAHATNVQKLQKVVIVTFSVTPEGKLGEVTWGVGLAKLPPALKTCLQGATAGAKFSKSQQGGKFTYPLVLVGQ